MKDEKELLKKTLVILLVVAVATFLLWAVKREINFSFSYKDKIDRAIEDKIAPIERELEEIRFQLRKLQRLKEPS